MRGLAVILPPLLTIVVFIWAWSMIDSYILVPCEHAAGHLIGWSIKEVRSGFPAGTATPITANSSGPTTVEYNDREYVQLGRGGKWIPRDVWEMVENNLGKGTPPTTADEFLRPLCQGALSSPRADAADLPRRLPARALFDRQADGRGRGAVFARTRRRGRRSDADRPRCLFRVEANHRIDLQRAGNAVPARGGLRVPAQRIVANCLRHRRRI